MFWCFGNKSRNYHCKIVLLDETEFIQEIQETSKGQQLLDVVNKHLNLMETAYFGLRFIDSSGQRHWLDPNKKIVKQLKGLETFTFYFGVKFYSSDPCKLLEEITRYQFFLQVKQDVYQGRLPLSFDLAAELFAYAIQSELGDYDPRRHQPGYASEFRFTSNQTPDLEAKAAELHKGLCGRVPAVAELNFLDRVKWLDMYGVDLHPVLGEDNMEYFLGLTPSGVLVLKNKTKVGNYFWPRISKVYFKGRYFMIRVRDKNNDESTYGFELPNRQACKHLWKCCVDHHAFFKLTQVREVPGQSGKPYGLENKFSYGIRSDKNFQISTLQSRLRTPPTFIRVPSRRFQKRLGQPDGADAGTQAKEEDVRENNNESRLSLMTPHPVPMPSLHRSTSVPSALPRTTSATTAPWEDPRFGSRGLYSNSTNPSPRSIRSAGALPSRRSYSHQRSGSIDSTASYDYRKRKHHQSRRMSDNESDVSKASRCSKQSRSSRTSHGHRRSGSQSGDGSDSESQHRHRRHSRRKKHGSTYEFVDSEDQWKEVQRQKQEQSLIRAQNAIVKDLSKRRSGYVNSGVETESETNYAQKRRHRKHRSRSRSPDSKTVLPSDVKRYIEYNLIDASALTEEEKRDIKYTKVQSDSRLFKIRYSPVSNRSQMSKMASRSSINGNPHKMQGEEEDPPPPYTSNEQNGYLTPKQIGDNDVEHEESIAVPPQIPKVSLNNITQNGCIPRVTPKFENDGPLVSVQNTTNQWMSNNRSSSLNRSHVKSDVLMNGGMQQLKQDVQTYQPDSFSKNIRLVNGHFYPVTEKPQVSTAVPATTHRVTFCNENVAYQYPQTYSSSRSWTQNTPRQNGEVPQSSEVQDSQNSHEMSTEL